MQRMAGHVQSTAFRGRIADLYKNGAGWLFAANLEQISAKYVHPLKDKPAMTDLGFDTAQSFIVERRDVGGRTENRARRECLGGRRGVRAALGRGGGARWCASA